MVRLANLIKRVTRSRGAGSVFAIWVILSLTLLGYYLVLPPRAGGVSSGIVISQIYGGGGNSGAIYKNDFIELFNRGTTTINVTGWSVQYASSTGTTWQVTNLSGSIAAGKYYLIQEAAGGGGTTNLPTPDATGSINMAATAGKVALVNNTTALSGACPSSASIIDLVGFGSTANCFEGSGPTPAPSNTNAVLRTANGCTDTDNNTSDFSAAAANPRNSASPAISCGTNAPIAPTCPANLSTTGGTAASAGVSATDPDGTVTSASITNITPSNPGMISLTGFTAAGAVGGTASATLQVSNATPVGNYSVTITWSNNDSTPQTADCTVAVAVAPAMTGIVVSQLYGGGGNSGATFKNDFIELFNRGTETVTITGWSVQYTSSTGTSWQATNLSGSIAPGKYYLIQEAAGTGGTTDLPTPDATGNIAMSASAGKVALVNNTTALSGACPSSVSIIDHVGFGSGSNCFEGSGPTPAPSNTNAVLRKANGCTDTDNNSSDFSAGSPNPRNSSSPASVCSNNAPITTDCPPGLATTAGTAASEPVSATDSDGTVTAASITNISPSNPGTITLTGFTPAGSIGGTATATLQADNSTPPGNYSVTITWSNNDATSQTATCTVSVSVIPGTTTAIHDIQGPGTTSPFAGTQVTTSGIVTGVRSNGFFIQEPDATVDADPNTSEGIFVFTSSAPPAQAAVGNKVLVGGTVQEFVPSQDPLSPPTTEIAGSPTVILLSTVNPLPTPIILTTSDTGTGGLSSGSIENLEKYEGMRVRVNSLTVVAPTQGSVSEANATSTSNGVFYGVLTGVARPFREPGIQANDPPPVGSGVTIPPVPRFDFNPERIRVNSLGLVSSTAINVTAGATMTGLVGPLDYSFRTYTILTDPASITPAPIVSGNVSFTAVPVPTVDEFTVASFNMERFFDTTDDPSVDDVVLTTTAFNNRLKKVSLAIRSVMRMPDVIGVEEMENLSTLQAVADKVNSDAGASNPGYVAYLVEGNDVGGIDVGFLVKSAIVAGSTPRVTVNAVVQEGKTVTFANPDGSTSLLNDRPPLRLIAVINHADGRSFPITVIVNHLRSLNGIDSTAAGSSGWPTEGARVRAKRRAQAEFLANLIQARQVADPNERIISIGDYNAFGFNDGYVDSIGTIKGTPTAANQVVLASSDLVNPDLIDLIEMAPDDQRYSFSFDGDAQAIDHELITSNLLAAFSHLSFARNNADFPETFRNDSTRPERISDHDMPVAYFTFPCAITCAANITKSNDTDKCGAVVTYAGPTASNNCFQVSCSPSSGSLFPVGVTTVNCAEPISGGALCSFTVTVTDSQPPKITCPPNTTRSADPDKCSAVVSYLPPGVSDNCTAASSLAPACSPASGSTFPKGTSTVLCTVIDAAGNQASCAFTVRVNDTQPPVFASCPDNVYTAAAASCPLPTSKMVSYAYPAANENCSGVVTVTCNPPTGSTFPVGASTVNCAATDTSGNTSTCSFQMKVFTLCLVDETNTGHVVLVNTNTGEFRYCCNGAVVATGVGALTVRGCIVTVDSRKGDRSVMITADTTAEGVGKGTAFIERAGTRLCQISDHSMAGNACSCN